LRAELLISAGEGSGDAMAAPVLARLGVPAFGLGGAQLSTAGLEQVARLRQGSAMGVGDVLVRAPDLLRAAHDLLASARRRRPAAALLVGFSEFNARLGKRLRELGTRVLWYGPPQIWAWRRGRGERLSKSCDRMAVVLPFEEDLWRRLGVDAHFVGHPAMERPEVPRDVARERFGMTPYAEYVALLPGSRPHEVREHLRPMLDAVGELRNDRGAIDARVIVASALPRRLADRITRQARAAGVTCIESAAPNVLPAFDVALAASGTVTLECVAANVPPVIVYRTGPVSELLARRLLEVSFVGLPNHVLGERIFPELLQSAVVADQLADEATRLLDDRDTWQTRCGRVQARLCPSDGQAAPSERVAELLSAWLS
jgi:lipid-A-disaccharide synthase